MNTVIEELETGPAEFDLIDRIAHALPDEVRAEYYRELRHCRSLPESDEMLRLLRAMQFLVLLIEQAPSRVAEERERLDTILAAAVDNISRMGAASESYHAALQQKLAALPRDVAYGIRPEAVAAQINENLRQEFNRSTIPKTAEALAGIADRMRKVCSEFSATSDSVSEVYRSAAEEARKSVADLKSEIAQASEGAARFTREVAEKSSRTYRWSLILFAVGTLVIGLAMGMMFERWLLSPGQSDGQSRAPVVQPAPAPVSAAPALPKGKGRK